MKEVMGDEQLVYQLLQELYNEVKRPFLSSELETGLKGRGISRSKRAIQGILRKLIDKELIREKMITEDRDLRGKMGYVPLKGTYGVSPKKIQKWKLDYLIKILEDGDLSKEIQEKASMTLKNFCSSRTKIGKRGKGSLKQFFSKQLDNPREDPIYEQIIYALHGFMNFHLEDDLGWALRKNRIPGLFKKNTDVVQKETDVVQKKSTKLRKHALQLLGVAFLRYREKKKEAKANGLIKLFENTFFDPTEEEKIVSIAFDNLKPIMDSHPHFLEDLLEKCKSEDKVIRDRCRKYLKDTLPTM